MAVFRKIFDYYLKSSIHVALAVCALILLTQHMFKIPYDCATALFGFFGTVTGYNFVKYDEILRVRKKNSRREIKAYAALSAICFIGAVYCFLQFRLTTQLISFLVLALTALYTLPFFPNRRNARNWSGVKIYIVSLCWMGVTVILPLIDADIPFSLDFLLKCCQRFILVFVLILIFEIIDLAKDDLHLRTVPQEIGVQKTKILGYFLLMVFYTLEFFKSETDVRQLIVNFVIIVATAGFLLFANEKRPKYYSSFWAESIPILWFLLVLLFG